METRTILMLASIAMILIAMVPMGVSAASYSGTDVSALNGAGDTASWTSTISQWISINIGDKFSWDNQFYNNYGYDASYKAICTSTQSGEIDNDLIPGTVRANDHTPVIGATTKNVIAREGWGRLGIVHNYRNLVNTPITDLQSFTGV